MRGRSSLTAPNRDEPTTDRTRSEVRDAVRGNDGEDDSHGGIPLRMVHAVDAQRTERRGVNGGAGESPTREPGVVQHPVEILYGLAGVLVAIEHPAPVGEIEPSFPGPRDRDLDRRKQFEAVDAARPAGSRMVRATNAYGQSRLRSLAR